MEKDSGGLQGPHADDPAGGPGGPGGAVFPGTGGVVRAGGDPHRHSGGQRRVLHQREQAGGQGLRSEGGGGGQGDRQGDPGRQADGNPRQRSGGGRYRLPPGRR